MNILFYTPDETHPEMVYGAIVDAEDEARNLMEYIPFPLFPETQEAVTARGWQWLLNEIPTEFTAFLTAQEAGGFLHEMAFQVQHGIPHPVVVQVLLNKYRGEWRSKSEYTREEYKRKS